jgi:hypothetical protein
LRGVDRRDDSPARRIVMRSEMCSTSRILWLMKMMLLPSAMSFVMMANRPSTSMSVRAADGSSRIEQLRAVVERLQDLDALLRADGDLGDELVELHVEAVFFGQRLDLPAPRGAVNEQTLAVAVAQDDVLEHGHGLDQHEMLVHHADAELHGLAGGLDALFLPVQENLALRSADRGRSGCS